MPLILFHSSKTMRVTNDSALRIQQPVSLDKANELADYLKALSPEQLAQSMHISESMAKKTAATLQQWNASPESQTPAIDSFLGDMYSGLQAPLLSAEDRAYANKHLRILSGLYGVLKPLDGIMPYRLEMGYKLPKPPYDDLYSYWTDAVIAQLPDSEIVFNLSSVEYTKSLLPKLRERIIITPVFKTLDPKTGEYRQVVVHSKIARGAFVRWLIQGKCSLPNQAKKFNLLGYRHEPAGSTETAPLFICDEFQGKDLSLRRV